MRDNNWKFKSVKTEIEVRCGLIFPLSNKQCFMANYLWLELLKPPSNWRDEGAWEAASLLKDSCLIINYWGRNRKYCWNSPSCAAQVVVVLPGLLQQQSFWGLKTPLLIFRKPVGEKGTWHCCTFLHTLNTSGHCYKPRMQVLSPKAENAFLHCSY